MGLDNGIYVRSNRRKITRDMLPLELDYPFEKDYDDDGVEILYWRKNWGIRTEVVNTFNPDNNNEYHYLIETPEEVFTLIKIIVSWMDKEKWEEEGDSIWEYEEVRHMLQQNVINLAIIAAFMKNNPDIYLTFYDSY